MGWYFRKSVRLGSGFRINFSKSGVGVSGGVKGFRVSTGPRGTYVNLGRHGIYYRQKIGGPYGLPPQSSFPSQPPTAPQAGPQNVIPTANVSQLVDSNSAATLSCLNEHITKPAYAPAYGVVGFALAISAGVLIHMVMFILIAGLTVYLVALASRFDKGRRTYRLHYQFDAASLQRWQTLNSAFVSLRNAQRIWCLDGYDETSDWKHNAGAERLWTRSNVFLSQEKPCYIESNIVPYCLRAGVQRFYFMPDRVYVYQNGRYGAVDYEGLIVDYVVTDFVEGSTVIPPDAVVAGYTWQYVNQNGGPDRRFSINPRRTIVQYGTVLLESRYGIRYLFQVSSVPAAQAFVFCFMSAIHPSKPIPHQAPPNQAPHSGQASSGQHSQTQTRQYTTYPPPKPKSTTPSYYQVLGLEVGCTKEQADRKYKELVFQYHPDRVTHLAPEFQALAERRMKEINIAYHELKKARSW